MQDSEARRGRCAKRVNACPSNGSCHAAGPSDVRRCGPTTLAIFAARTGVSHTHLAARLMIFSSSVGMR